jgi:cytochrome c peroxidase
VANAVSNSITEIDTNDHNIVRTVELPPQVGTFPSALAVSNDEDRDDDDERLYVACFFAVRRPGKTGLDEGQDDQREGRIAVFDTDDFDHVGTVALGPVADSGFSSNGSVLDLVGTENGAGGANAPDPANPPQNTFPTGCFPNQLASIALHPDQDRGYVVSTAASPNGPFAFNVNVQGVVSVWSTNSELEVTSGNVSSVVHQKAPLNLNLGLRQDLGTQPVIFHSNPVAIAWRPDGDEAWLLFQHADLMVRMTVDPNGVPTINAPLQNGGSSIVRIDLQSPPGGLRPLKGPRGIAINREGDRAYVYGFVSRSVSVIDLDERRVTGTAASSALPAPGTPDATIQMGAELFFGGRGPEGRLSSEGWGACIACHPDGLADGVTWMFDGGPRQTIPLDGMFARSLTGGPRILNWSAVRDENHDFELNTRGVSGGRGLIDDDRPLFVLGGARGAAPEDTDAVLEHHQLMNTVGSANDLAGGATLPPLLGGRRDFGTATLPDGRVYLIGGRSGTGAGSVMGSTDAVLEFDPRLNAVRARSSTGFTLRHSLGAAAVPTAGGPRIYAIGGYVSTGPAALPVTLVQEYNPATDTWRTVAPLPVAVAEAGVAAAGPLNKGEPVAQVHVLGGNAGTGAAPVATGSVHRFTPDPAGPGTWATLGLTITPRRSLGAAAVVRGAFPTHVFAIGGINPAGLTTALVEAYAATLSQTAPTDPSMLTRVTTPLTQLPASRHSFGIGTSNNRIYVVGGVDGAGVEVDTILEYNPAANPAPPGVPGAAGTPSGVWTVRTPLPQTIRSAGVSSPPVAANLLPVANAGRDARQDAINEWIRARVRSHVAPLHGSTQPAVQAGRALFGQDGLTGVPGFSCATCHGGARWTRSVVDYVAPPSPDLLRGPQEVIGAELRQTATQPQVLFDVGTFVPFTAGRNVEGRPNPADVGQRVNALGANGFNIPSLLGVASSAPYYHNGLAASLEEVLNGAFDGNGTGPVITVHRVAGEADRANLIAFLRSIDELTMTFP